MFKKIGQDKDSDPTQVLRTLESLATNLGPPTPGLHQGDVLTPEARVTNTGHRTQGLAWDGNARILAPGQSWVRRDLCHVVTDQEASAQVAFVASTVAHLAADSTGYRSGELSVLPEE